VGVGVAIVDVDDGVGVGFGVVGAPGGPTTVVTVLCAVAVTGPTVGLVTRERMMQLSVVTAGEGQSGGACGRRPGSLGTVYVDVDVPLMYS
jgi:hypothetical protein